MEKKIFVTGAAGFIGFHLIKALHAGGVQAIGFDNFNPYYDVALKRDRAAELQKLGVEIIEGDICSFETLSRATAKATHMVHLAAQAGVRYSLENPQTYVKSNLEGFVNVLEACRHQPGMKLIYASSSSVYGLNSKVPFKEDDRSDQQASLYGATKKSNELMAATYHHLFKIPTIGLRFFTVYGPWGRPDMAYYSFTKAILEGKPIDVYNHGKMQRDFTYIDDIVQGVLAAIDSAASCELFNLGNHQPVPLMEFIETVERACGKKAQLNFAPMQSGDVLATYADIEKSRQLLGFAPRTSLKEGIPQFVKWFRHYHSL